MFSVKKCYLFEGVSPSFSILAEHLECAQNAHGVRKIDFLRDRHYFAAMFLSCVFGQAIGRNSLLAKASPFSG